MKAFTTRFLPLFSTLSLFTALSLTGCWSSGSGSQEDGTDGSGLSETDLNAQREGRFGSGSIPTAEGEGIFRDIRFGYDSYAIDDEARQDIEYNARVLKQNPDISVTLEGHCDERGTVEYNMALGAERARAVKSALAAAGVSSSKIDTISYGEEVPLENGHDEGAWSKNRRVHFSASREMGSVKRETQF